MAFSRVNSSGWSTNQGATSAQMNQLDINVSNALDRTTAGDSIATGATIAWASGSLLDVQSGGMLQISSGGALQNIGLGPTSVAMNTTTTGLVTLPQGTITVANASAFPPGGGNFFMMSSAGMQTISYATIVGNNFQGCTGGTGSAASGTQIFGSTMTMNSAGLSFNGTGSLRVYGGGTMLITGSGSLLQTQSGGRIQMADNDWVTFSAPRSYQKVLDLAAASANGSGWNVGADGAIAPAAGGGVQKQAIIPIAYTHNGAQLTRVDVFFTTQGAVAGRSGVLPASNISVTLLTRTIVSGSPLTTRGQWIASVSYTPVSYGSYTDGTVKSQTLTFATSPTIDNTTTQYALLIGDEWGANAVGGTVFHQAIAYYGNISDMRFA